MLLVLLSGCYPQAGIKLLHLQPNKSVFFSGNTCYWDEIVPTPIDSKFIYFIYRKGDYLTLDKRDLSGVRLKDHQIPLFSVYYGATPHALSQDESKLVYFKDNTSSIYLYDLLTKSESLLCGNLVYNKYTIEGIFWMNNNTVIILLDDISTETGEVIRIDVSTKKITGKLEHVHPMDFSFSPANMLLAVAPMMRGWGIIIVDLEKMIAIEEIPNSNQRSWMNEPAWNQEGTKLAYVDTNNILSIYDMKSKRSTTVKQIPKDNVVYFVAYLNENTCVIRHGLPGGKNKLYFIDLNTKRDTRIVSDIWGAVIFVDDGNVIAYEKH